MPALLTLFSQPVAGDEPAHRLRIDACSLLEVAEIAAVIGAAVDQGERRDLGKLENGGYSSTCLWKVSVASRADAADAPLGGASFVILNAMRWPRDSGLARTFLDAFRDAAASGEIPATPVERKVGDEALWWGDGLAVRSGDVSFGVSVFLPGAPAKSPGEREEQLARRILPRLEPRP
jgi:hypothetical protein